MSTLVKSKSSVIESFINFILTYFTKVSREVRYFIFQKAPISPVRIKAHNDALRSVFSSIISKHKAGINRKGSLVEVSRLVKTIVSHPLINDYVLKDASGNKWLPTKYYGLDRNELFKDLDDACLLLGKLLKVNCITEKNLFNMEAKMDLKARNNIDLYVLEEDWLSNIRFAMRIDNINIEFGRVDGVF